MTSVPVWGGAAEMTEGGKLKAWIVMFVMGGAVNGESYAIKSICNK